jgi:hypothetical protein
MSRIYIAGRMRGLPLFGFPAFFEAEKDWRQAGWDVVNPARLDQELDAFDPATDPARDEGFYMRRDLPEVARCDAIALLPGWRDSSGAAKELAVVRVPVGIAVFGCNDDHPVHLVRDVQRRPGPEKTVLEQHGENPPYIDLNPRPGNIPSL